MGFLLFGAGVLVWAVWIRVEMDWAEEEEERRRVFLLLKSPNLALSMANATAAMRRIARALS